MKRININENKINIVFDIEDNGQIYGTRCSKRIISAVLT